MKKIFYIFFLTLITFFVVKIFDLSRNKPRYLFPNPSPKDAIGENSTYISGDKAGVIYEVNQVSKNNIEVKDFKYAPATLTIKKGESLTWTNIDDVGHTATSDEDGNFDTGLLEKDESKSIIFAKAGTFNYHCTPHPWMKATITVIE